KGVAVCSDPIDTTRHQRPPHTRRYAPCPRSHFPSSRNAPVVVVAANPRALRNLSINIALSGRLARSSGFLYSYGALIYQYGLRQCELRITSQADFPRAVQLSAALAADTASTFRKEKQYESHLKKFHRPCGHPCLRRQRRRRAVA